MYREQLRSRHGGLHAGQRMRRRVHHVYATVRVEPARGPPARTRDLLASPPYPTIRAQQTFTACTLRS